MQTFTGWQYLLIDAANQAGLDKLLFEERIEWATEHLDHLEDMVDQAGKTKPLFLKACHAIRQAQRGEATGHLVGFDASCSGIQIMSAITGCYDGAMNTGLVLPNVRSDAYSTATALMNEKLAQSGQAGALTVPRDKAKNALMTAFYGSKEQPKIIFGDATPELEAFYLAAAEVAPGAWELLQDLIGSWNPQATHHCWQLPDGFEVQIKVMVDREIRIEVDELGHASFTYQFKENLPKKKGVSNAANVVHSIDGYVVRCMQRRCNYNKDTIEWVNFLVQQELAERAAGSQSAPPLPSKAVHYYCELFSQHGVADVVICPYLTREQVRYLDQDHLEKLGSIVESMLCHEPFEILTVHDEFKCHANNVNYLRSHYINILCDLADGHVLDAVFTDLMGQPANYSKLSTDLSTHISHSNYALT